MSGHDDLVGRLEALGRQPVPAPDPAFLAGLRARLLAAPPGDDRRSSVSPLDPTRRRRTVLVGVAAAAVLVVVAAIVARADDPQGPTLVDVTDTELEYADGSRVPAGAGVRLAPGDRVVTGSGGRAVISTAGEHLETGPDQEVVIGEDVAAPVVEASVPTEPAPTGEPAQPVQSTPPNGSSEPAKLDLSVQVTQDEVTVLWSGDPGPAFDRWVVLRAEWVEPTWPADDATSVLMISDARARTTWRDARPPRSKNLNYRVVAVDADGVAVGDTGVVRTYFGGHLDDGSDDDRDGGDLLDAGTLAQRATAVRQRGDNVSLADPTEPVADEEREPARPDPGTPVEPDDSGSAEPVPADPDPADAAESDGEGSSSGGSGDDRASATPDDLDADDEPEGSASAE